MTEQLSLAGFNAAPARTDRLFFGIFPDPPGSARIAGRAQNLRDEHGLSGRPLETNRFHVTLCHLDDYDGLPAGIVATAKEAAATLMLPPFDVVFDHAGSFRHGGNNPLVLLGGEGLAALKAFRRSLFEALKMHGLGCQYGPSFTPHVTLLYDNRLVAEQPVEAVGWKVREFVLVHSLLGQKRHVPLARWPLRD